jgi:hypothetical protein
VYGRALLFHEAGHAGVARDSLQTEHPFGPKDIRTAGTRGPPEMILKLILDP